jgi:predicted dithiol-disulfide oxidoreductase (DUF899 family)
VRSVRRRVADYALSGPKARVTLSQLFGDRGRLIVIRNIGFGCPCCTMWAAGFKGRAAVHRGAWRSC